MRQPLIDRDPGDETREALNEPHALSTGLCIFDWCDDEALPDSDLCASCRDELGIEEDDE